MRGSLQITRWLGAVALVATLAAVAAPIRAEADAAVPLRIVTTEVAGLVAGAAASVPLDVVGGTPPYRWVKRTNGPEWVGLSLAEDGTLSGTPYTSAVTTLLVRVFDATGRHVDASIRLQTVEAPRIGTWSLADGYRGTAYQEWIDTSGGLEPLTVLLDGGTLPPGIGLRSLDPMVGNHWALLEGTPTATGTWSPTLRVTDAAGNTATRDLSLTVREAQVPEPPGTVAHHYFNAVVWDSSTFDGGAPVTGFVVTPYRGDVAQAPIEVDGSTHHLDLVGLLPKGPHTFTVAAKNRIGTGPPSPRSEPIQVLSTPSAPTGLTATRGDRKVVLTWTAAEDGGEPIDRHLVEAVDADGNTVASFQQGSATTATVSGLTTGASYRFRVKAGSLHYQGAWTAWTAPVVVAGAASIPVGVTASPRDEAAVVRWSPPLLDNGFPVTGYVITPFEGGSSLTSVTVGGAARSATITGLVNGSEVTFTVAAVNAAGTGPASSASNPVTPAAQVRAPTAPEPTLALPGNATATVSWRAPASDGGSPVTGYVVTPYVGTTAKPSQTFRSAATTQILTGLANGTSYTFRIAALNAAGTGPRSVASLPVTVGTPSAPTSPKAVPGATSATVTWTTPPSNGAAITGYVITPYLDGDPLPSTRTWTTTPSAVVPGLLPGREYRFVVAARNSRGIGARSAPTTAVTVGVPTAPAWVRAVPGATSATVTWAPPAPGTGAPSEYVVIASKGSEAVDLLLAFAPDTSVTFPGLEPGASYTFEVQPWGEHGAGPKVRSAAVTVGAPSAPTDVRALAGNASITLTATAAAPNGSPVTSYRVTPYVGSTARPTQTFSGNATAWKVTGLANGTVHTFRVVAVNARGASPSITTDAIRVGVPRAPTGVKAVAGKGRATVSWTAPTNNGAAITRYVITPYLDGVAQPARSFDATTRTRAITGLRAGGRYTFTVRAANARGTSAASTPSAAVRPS